MAKTSKSPKTPKKTYREILESQGIVIIPTVPGEFVAYKPSRDGAVDMDFKLDVALENLDFFDYEEVAMGRGFYVMGDVTSRV